MNKEDILFNHVLDALIFSLSSSKVSLFDLSNNVKPVISYRKTLKNKITYNFQYRESSLLVKPKQ